MSSGLNTHKHDNPVSILIALCYACFVMAMLMRSSFMTLLSEHCVCFVLFKVLVSTDDTGTI
jgi:hypothetical protein